MFEKIKKQLLNLLDVLLIIACTLIVLYELFNNFYITKTVSKFVVSFFYWGISQPV